MEISPSFSEEKISLSLVSSHPLLFPMPPPPLPPPPPSPPPPLPPYRTTRLDKEAIAWEAGKRKTGGIPSRAPRISSFPLRCRQPLSLPSHAAAAPPSTRGAPSSPTVVARTTTAVPCYCSSFSSSSSQRRVLPSSHARRLGVWRRRGSSQSLPCSGSSRSGQPCRIGGRGGPGEAARGSIASCSNLLSLCLHGV